MKASGLWRREAFGQDRDTLSERDLAHGRARRTAKVRGHRAAWRVLVRSVGCVLTAAVVIVALLAWEPARAQESEVVESRDRPYDLEAAAGAGDITLTWQDPETHPSRGLYQILRHRPELGEAEPLIYVRYTSATERTFTDSAVEPGVLYVYAVKAVKDFFGFLGPASDSVEVRMPPQGTSQPNLVSNSPATGAPIISGTPQLGETLTASEEGIEDADGLTGATFSWQWLSNDGTTDAVIERATEATYTVAATDVGKTLKVQVTFTDDGDTDETLVSAATSEVVTSTIGGSGSSELSVADAEATEDSDETLDFVVTLDPAATGTVTVDYATANGTATASADYTFTSGTLTFQPGETTKTIAVPVLDDAVEDDGETFTLALSNPSGALIDDAQAVGTIRNSEEESEPPALADGVPRRPDFTGLYIGDGQLKVVGTLNLGIAVPVEQLSSVVSSFKIQWKSGSQDYDSSRQEVLDPKPASASGAHSTAFVPRYAITGLTNGVEYTVQIIATNSHGDSLPSEERTGTPNTKADQLRQYIKEDIVEEHESAFPWLRHTWNYMQNNGVALYVRNYGSSKVGGNCRNGQGLAGCYVSSMTMTATVVDGDASAKKRAILHEMAHIYTLANGVSATPAPLALAHLYFMKLQGSSCDSTNLYADTLASLVLGGSTTGAGRWNSCSAATDSGTALAVARSAASGQTPS